jgi:hypothetical protein
VWDYRQEAAKLNAEVFDHEIARSELHQCSVEILRRSFHSAESLCLPSFLDADTVDREKLLRVISRWMRGCALTPPCLVVLENGLLGKRDGFHRLVATIIVGATKIPFWSIGPCAVAGTVKIALEPPPTQ